VTRFRALETLTPAELIDLYDNHNWSLFVQAERDEATIRMGRTFEQGELSSIADLSAGGAQITPAIAQHYGIEPVLGDLSRQYGYPIFGPIETTVQHIAPVDLFVCSETLEHLEDPDLALDLIRPMTKYLLVTTPIWEEPHMTAHGHLWTWRQSDVETMLKDAGFTPVSFEEILIFGVWIAK
jgi:hypothetical protein